MSDGDATRPQGFNAWERLQGYLLAPGVQVASRAALHRARNRPAILTWQDRRLRRLVRHIRNNVPYYATRLGALGLGPRDVRGAADLDVLPLVAREDLQELTALFVATDRSLRACEVWGTSGTTGRPVRVVKPVHWQLAFYARLQARLPQLGLRPADFPAFGSNYIYVTDTEYEPERRRYTQRMPIWRLSRIEKIDIRPEFHESPLAPVELISRFKPVILHGKPSSLVRLGSLMKCDGLARSFAIRPKVVVTGAEQLTPETRTSLTRSFACPVFDSYGTTEVGLIGCECGAFSGLHFEDDAVIVEVVRNGLRVPPGEVGELVVTDLINLTMPIVRYCTGDLGRVTYERCPCGLAYPRITELQGRVVDMFVTPAGEPFNPFVLLGGLPKIGLKQYQLVQTSPHRVVVRFVGDVSSEAVVAAVSKEIRANLGDEASIMAERVEAIDIPGRKTRLYVNAMRGPTAGGGFPGPGEP
jgi:phenylacetate-CoA ligase